MIHSLGGFSPWSFGTNALGLWSIVYNLGSMWKRELLTSQWPEKRGKERDQGSSIAFHRHSPSDLTFFHLVPPHKGSTNGIAVWGAKFSIHLALRDIRGIQDLSYILKN